MSLKNIAKETLLILDEGKYISRSGKTVEFISKQRAAVSGTVLYTPEQAYRLLTKAPELNKLDIWFSNFGSWQGATKTHSLSSVTEERRSQGPKGQTKWGSYLIPAPKQGICDREKPIIEVTDETMQVAASRLVQNEGCLDLVLLNYASARNPGGGFINGAKSQEEDLARCSGLYPCLLTQPSYYEVNRAQKSLLYTDHIIYSPNVPWFRTHCRELLEDVFLASVITAPAPNAGQALRRDANAWTAIEEALRRRAGLVLAVARDNAHRTVLLGAWGCGVFLNNPSMVADAFGNWLTSLEFRGCFDRVIFAVYDPSQSQKTLRAFQARFQV